MRDTMTQTSPAQPAQPALSPIQRAYLVGAQDGLELSGPARYYLSCDLRTDRVARIGARLRRLVRDNDILRIGESGGLSPQTLPQDIARHVDADVRWVGPADFESANDAVRRTCTAVDFAFGDWPQFEVTVVRTADRARLHLVYSLWLMDAASLAVFLTELVADDAHDHAQAPADADVSAQGGAAPGGRAARRPGRDRSPRDERFWRRRAASLADPAELPLRPEWRRAGPRVTHRMVTVDAAAARRVCDRASAHGLTPAMVYLAVYGVVLGRLGGGCPHTITVLRSSRTASPTAATLGNQGTTMPLEIPATSGRSFVEVARAVQSGYLTQAMHGSLSGAEIARLAGPAADLRRLTHPFAFTALDADGAGEAALGLRRRWHEVQLRVPQVLIDHQVISESDGTVRLGFDWRTDAFDPGFVDDLVTRCAELVGELAASDESWTSAPARVPLPATARTDAPAAGVGAPVAEGETLHGCFLRCAAENPDAPAVHDALGSLSYAALADRAAAVADLLSAAGAGSGDRVAVHLPRGRGQVIAVLGSLLAGCVYIPLDHATPPGRLDSIARRGDVRFALTEGDPATDERWSARGVSALPLPSGPAAPGDRTGHAAPCPTAYVIFTSGSTGEPKGVVVSHAAVLTTINAVNEEFGVGRTDRVLSVSSIGFDLSVYDSFGPLLRGGSVVMLSEDSAKSPAQWADLIERHGVTLWNSAPALASLLAEEGRAVPSVRAFLLSGDWIPLTLPEALGRLAPGSAVVSLGGATEGAIWSISHRVTEADRAGRSIPYGRPLPGQDILVLDAERNVCPPWQIGEIHIAGAAVADGYANDPQKTAAAFLTDPVFGRIYRTGDRGRRHPDGVVEFLGRTDNQVKLNGHRVELGEIEHCLEGAPGIQRCAVCVRGDGRRKKLVAYVTLTTGAPDNWRDEATATIKDTLAHYMLPDALVPLDALPLNSNGKLDRRKLAALPLEDTAVDGCPPGTPTADAQDVLGRDLYRHEVARCWHEVLGEAPGQGSFFEAGGGSYDAIRLLSLLRGRFGHTVAFGDFMAHPTVAGLADLCRGIRAAGTPGIWTHQPRAGVAPRLRLVLFPPVGGGVSCYAGVIGELAGDIDVHVVGLDAPLPTGVEDGDSLAGLARRCLRELPGPALTDGVPLVLAGWSFGGALAFEAARARGKDVARVVVVDTPASGTAHRRAAGPTIKGFLRDVQQTTGVHIDPAQAADDPELGARFAVYRQNLTLLRAWEPPAVDVPLVEFRAAQAPAEPDDAAWARLAHRADVTVLAGGHFDVFHGDHIRRITEAIEGAKSNDRI
ncbi:amino acid adenylation domain-containing protein [Streptomyces pseudovenezuelae]|uniref:non-ribosomal peptide synthetase n=1 Tax=Streptomyces pseudovenezuelae TaxID=67350 RepID=UPI00381A1BD5